MTGQFSGEFREPGHRQTLWNKCHDQRLVSRVTQGRENQKLRFVYGWNYGLWGQTSFAASFVVCVWRTMSRIVLCPVCSSCCFSLAEPTVLLVSANQKRPDIFKEAIAIQTKTTLSKCYSSMREFGTRLGSTTRTGTDLVTPSSFHSPTTKICNAQHCL